MDSIDVKILGYLRENSRVNASVIGEKINMSVSAVIERIKKLESSGIIKQYTAILEPQLIGKEFMAFVSVSLEHPKYNDRFVEFVCDHPDIIECNYITGDFDFILKVITYSTGSFAQILNQIKSIPGVSHTKTIVVMSTFKNECSVLPEVPAKKTNSIK